MKSKIILWISLIDYIIKNFLFVYQELWKDSKRFFIL